MKLIVTALFLFSFEAAAVTFKGVIDKDQKIILGLYPTLALNKPDYSIIDLAVAELSQTKNYNTVKATYTNGSVSITATPSKKIKLIEFIGNKAFTDSQLVKISKLKTNSSFSKEEINLAMRRLKSAYINKSYLNTVFSVDAVNDGDLNQSYKLRIKVKENKVCKISKINFISNNKSLNKSLRLNTKKYLKYPLSEKILEKINIQINEYLKGRQYYFVDIASSTPTYNKSKNKAEITYKIENPYKYEFYFLGNDKLTRSTLTSEINGLYESNWSKDPVNKILEKLKNLYQKKGYIKAKVKLNQKTIEKEFIKKFTININEGELVKVKNLKIGGRFSTDSDTYKDFLFTNSPEPFSNKIYTPDSLSKGIENLVTDMKNSGFLHAKHISTRTKYIKDYLVEITIILNEGPKTNVNSIEITGNKIITDEEILSQIPLEKGSILNLKFFEQSLNDISKYYYSLGFLEMKFPKKTKFIDYYKNNTQANLNYNIIEGPQIKIKSIRIEGNDFTEDYVILREILLRPGDILSADRLLSAQTNLTRLGLFTAVDIRTSDPDSDISNRDLLITVSERKPGLLKVGIGASNERGFNLRGYTGASYINLFGTARAINFRIDTETRFEDKDFLDQVWKISGSYVEPYLFNTLTRGRVRTEIERDLTGDDETLRSNLNRRIGFLVEKDLSKNLKGLWTVWSLDSQSRTLESTREKERVDVTGIGPSLTYDSRDNVFLPSKGLYSTIDVSYSSPVFGASDKAHFIKTEANFTTYFKLFTPKIIWANSIRGGYAAKVGNFDGGGIPEDYLFILGGLSTVRGYGGKSDIDRIPSSLEIDRTEQVLETKHASFGLFKTELRFSVLGDFGIVLFWDAGIVDIQGYDFKDPLRDSYGIGLRYNTPLGPFVLDYGIKANRLFGKRESSGRIHISIGTF